MVWRTTKWGGLLGAVFGFAVVWWVGAVAYPLGDDGDTVIIFSLIGAMVGFFVGLIFGAMSGTAAHLARRWGADRGAAATVAAVVVMVPLGLLFGGSSDLYLPTFVAGGLAGVTVWRLLGPDPQPARPTEPDSEWPVWGDPPR